MAAPDSPAPSVDPDPTAAVPAVSANTAWWHRHLDPEERRRVMDELAITPVPSWATRFTVMLTLSVVVAVMGLSANSAAVVIGAMLLAPLMTPVLATAACLSMSLLGPTARSVMRVVLATAWCIAIGYLISLILPDGPLPNEVLARTQPDVRDLVVALAAGAAGAYATVRKDVSSSLPGVAVAVALVPPLGAVGITLEAGQFDLATGAFLLYATNLAAIIFAGVMVFVGTGFVPPRRLANTAVQLLVAAFVAGAVVVAITLPLLDRSAAVVEEVRAESIVAEWLGDLALSSEVDVTDDRVLVQLRGFDAPPDERPLKEALEAELGPVNLVVEWVRTERATTTVPEVLSDEEALVAQVEPIVAAWLAAAGRANDSVVDSITVIDGAVVLVNAAGPGDPPSVDDLAERFEAELGTAVSVQLRWTEQRAITPGASTTTPEQLLEERVVNVVDVWAEQHGVVVDAARLDGDVATILVYGPVEPPIGVITEDIRAIAGSGTQVDIFFTPRFRVTTTVPFIDPFIGLEAPPSSTTGPVTTTVPDS
ncbi:MAG: DUF389 domain-containing protein [Actinomycetota bacterium]